MRKLVATLGKMGLTGQEIAETIWLAQKTVGQRDFIDITAQSVLEENEEADEPTGVDPSSASSPDEASDEPRGELLPNPAERSPSLALPPSYETISVPDARSLTQPLQLARALRPLAQRVAVGIPKILDEAATVEAVAETGVWQPILKPDSELWLDVALVFDTSPSMCLWQRLSKDLHRLLARYGEFRDVRLWRLQYEHNQVQLTSRRGVPHKPKELLTGDRRRLIVIVSDCVSPAWQDGTMQELIATWATKLPTVVFHVFPERLWSRTALVQSVPVRLKSRREGMPSNALQPFPQSVWDEERLSTAIDQAQVRLPVVSLEPDSLSNLAKVIAGDRRSRVLGIVWSDCNSGQVVDLPPVPSAIEDLADTFVLTASPTARELASLLAAAPVITLPIVRLIRNSMLPQASAVHDAEVFMSGLVTVSDRKEPTFKNAEAIAYEIFNDYVRDRLRAGYSKIDALTVIEKVSKHIARGLGKSVSEFKALLKRFDNGETPEETEFLNAFATVTASILRGLGREFRVIADSLALPPEDTEDIDKADDWLTDFDLQPLTYEVTEYLIFPPLTDFNFTDAELVEDPDFPPPLQTKEFTIIDLQLASDTEPTEELTEELERFNFKVATVVRQDNQWVIRQRQEEAYRYVEKLSEAANPSFLAGIARRIGFGNDCDLEMVSIPRGAFVMGSPEDEPERNVERESPQHEVAVSSFFMGRYPVTQAQWRAVAGFPQVNRSLNTNPSRFKGDRLPVERVSWYDAVEFCDRLSAHTSRQYRLPSEAEWEYACRAKTTTPFHFGDMILAEVANYDGNATYADGPKGEYRKKTTPVDHFGIANDFGLSDMHGNVFEWCQDHWHATYADAPTDGSAWVKGGDTSYRVARGGSWSFNPRNCRSAYRIRSFPDLDVDLGLGFRVVCTASRKQATAPRSLL
ncbi:MAG: formylglycine-generating enzyme family protein [Cyanobacteria bacterium P01_H01_bin.153]